MATMPSPPGRFSIDRLAQRLLNRSANIRAPMSEPLPAPSVRMNLAGRVGQSGAAASIPVIAGTMERQSQG